VHLVGELTVGFLKLNQVVHTVTTGLKCQHQQTQLLVRKHTSIKALFVATCCRVSVHCLVRSVQHVSVSKNACHMSMSEMFYKHWRQSQPSALTNSKRLELRIPMNHVQDVGTSLQCRRQNVFPSPGHSPTPSSIFYVPAAPQVQGCW
jgi:hypothetical protein